MEDFDRDDDMDMDYDNKILDYIIYNDINDDSQRHQNPPKGGCVSVFLVLLLVFLLLGPAMGGLI